MPQSQLHGRNAPPEGNRGVNASAIVSFGLALGVSLLRSWTKAGSRRARRTLIATRVQEPLNLSDFEDLRSRFEESGTAVEIRKPHLWNSLEGPPTRGLLLYNEAKLFLAFLTDDNSFKPPAELGPNGADWAAAQNMPRSMWTILNDDRMEAFLWPQSPAHTPKEYFAFEVNRGGRAVVSRTRFLRQFDFHWKTAFCEAEEGEDAAVQVASHLNISREQDNKCIFVFSVDFADLGLSVTRLESGEQTLRCGLYRACRADDCGADMAWSSWVDPGDDQVDFHRPDTFGWIQFRGQSD